MTQPDGYDPEDAANYSSLEAFAAKTGDDWKASQQSGLNDNLGPLPAGFTAILGMIGLIPVVGPTLSNIIGSFLRFFGVSPTDVQDPNSVDPSSIWGNVTDLFLKPLNAFAELIGGFVSDVVIPILDPTKILNLPGLFTGVLTGFQNIWSNWFGGTPSSTTVAQAAAEVAVTVEAVRILTKDGYNVQTFTTSNPSWPVPPGLADAQVVWAGAINGGGKGFPGGTATNNILAVAYGGEGGVDGGYRLAKVDPSTLGATLAITIGAGATVNGTAGGVTSIAGLVSGTPGVSGIEEPEGYRASTSKAGRGGRGGDSWNLQGTSITSYPGFAGEPSATAAGGAAGSGGNGGAGNTGNTGSLPLSGGSGGGGGGGRDGNFVTGYSGGNGGYPGGGSGGGGGATSSVNPTTAGPSGTPAAGFAFLIWK